MNRDLDALKEQNAELMRSLETINKLLTQAQTAWTATRRIDANRASARRLCYDAQACARAVLAKTKP